jgi:hypothetical protein
MMDELLRRALRYSRPGAWVDTAVQLGLKTRARFRQPARAMRAVGRRTVHGSRYLTGWNIARVGTFPAPHEHASGANAS